MRTSLLPALVFLSILSVWPAQQTSKTSSNASVRQELQAQAKAIADLAERIAALEAQMQKSTQSQASEAGSVRKTTILSRVKSELAMFDDRCKSEQDRAAAMALAQHVPALTYMGGAAMNCTERLKKDHGPFG